MPLDWISTRTALALTTAAAITLPLLGGALASSANAAADVTALSTVAGPPVLPAQGALLGSAVSGRPGIDVKTSVGQLEGSMGRKLDVHRIYDVWDDPQPNSITSWTVANGRTPALSIKADRRNGSTVRWASIAAGQEDATIRAQARGLKALNAPLFLALHHEPENDPGHGTPAEFVAAWRHYVNVFRAEGASNVSFTWIMMAWSFERSSIADSFYPGDDVVDILAADGYNWFGTAPDKEWRSLAAALDAFASWSAPHGKPLMVAEYGTLEDPAVPGRKAAWIAEAAAAMKAMPGLKVALYFHAPVEFPWWIDSSPSSVDAFAAMGRDPYYHTVPEAALSITPDRGPAPLATTVSSAGSYTAAAGNQQWRLDFGDGSAPVISTTPPGDVAHSFPAGTSTVELSVSNASGLLDVTTSTVTALPPPTTLTNSETSITATGATLNGRADPNGLPTSAWFQYGTTTSYGSATAGVPLGDGTQMVSLAMPVSGLAPNTVYHYRTAASNAAGTTTGSDGIFTTFGPPTALTTPETGVAATSATLNGRADPNGLPTTAWFQYGTTASYGSTTAATSIGSGTQPVPLSKLVTGLATNTVYHYRTVAQNSSGVSTGPDATLTTSGPPVAVSGAASAVTATSVAVAGSVDANGLASSSWFEYGTTTAYGRSTGAVPAGDSAGPVRVSATLGGLVGNTTYHYRAVARNSSGTAYGEDRTVSTFGPATVVSGGASALTTNGATVFGNVDPNGLATSYRVEYGTGTTYGAASTWRSAGSATWGSSVSVGLTGLASRTLYHYRVVATNSAGTTTGLDRTLTTR